MNKYFEKTGSPKKSNMYCSIVLRSAQRIGVDKDNDLSFVVERLMLSRSTSKRSHFQRYKNTVWYWVNLFHIGKV